jgi:hypothetical protein
MAAPISGAGITEYCEQVWVEVVPRFVELEVAVPHLSPAKW